MGVQINMEEHNRLVRRESLRFPIRQGRKRMDEPKPVGRTF